MKIQMKIREYNLTCLITAIEMINDNDIDNLNRLRIRDSNITFDNNMSNVINPNDYNKNMRKLFKNSNKVIDCCWKEDIRMEKLK